MTEQKKKKKREIKKNPVGERQTGRVRGDDALFWKGKWKIYPFLWNVEAWNKDAFTWATLPLLSFETMASLSLSTDRPTDRPSVLKSVKQSAPLREPKPIKTPINLRAEIYCKAAAPPVGRFLRYDEQRQDTKQADGRNLQLEQRPAAPPPPFHQSHHPAVAIKTCRIIQTRPARNPILIKAEHTIAPPNPRLQTVIHILIIFSFFFLDPPKSWKPKQGRRRSAIRFLIHPLWPNPFNKKKKQTAYLTPPTPVARGTCSNLQWLCFVFGFFLVCLFFWPNSFWINCFFSNDATRHKNPPFCLLRRMNPNPTRHRCEKRFFFSPSPNRVYF